MGLYRAVLDPQWVGDRKDTTLTCDLGTGITISSVTFTPASGITIGGENFSGNQLAFFLEASTAGTAVSEAEVTGSNGARKTIKITSNAKE